GRHDSEAARVELHDYARPVERHQIPEPLQRVRFMSLDIDLDEVYALQLVQILVQPDGLHAMVADVRCRHVRIGRASGEGKYLGLIGCREWQYLDVAGAVRDDARTAVVN